MEHENNHDVTLLQILVFVEITCLSSLVTTTYASVHPAKKALVKSISTQDFQWLLKLLHVF